MTLMNAIVYDGVMVAREQGLLKPLEINRFVDAYIIEWVEFMSANRDENLFVSWNDEMTEVRAEPAGDDHGEEATDVEDQNTGREL